MDKFVLIILPLVAGIVLYLMIIAFVKAPGFSLRAKFVKLGELKGKTKVEITNAIRPPNSITGTEDGKTVCQWIAPGYHIALLFDGEICEGVTHEFSG